MAQGVIHIDRDDYPTDPDCNDAYSDTEYFVDKDSPEMFCQQRKQSITVEGCLVRYRDVMAFEKTRDLCYGCAQGAAVRLEFSGGEEIDDEGGEE